MPKCISTTVIQSEIQNLEACLSRKSAIYDYGVEYHRAERRLAILKNPLPNYNLRRRNAVLYYLNARNSGCSFSYVRDCRRVALAMLKDGRSEFAGVV